jgi:hypothetical protein
LGLFLARPIVAPVIPLFRAARFRVAGHLLAASDCPIFVLLHRWW